MSDTTVMQQSALRSIFHDWKVSFDAYSIEVEKNIAIWVKENAKEYGVDRLNVLSCPAALSCYRTDFWYLFDEQVDQWIHNNGLDSKTCDTCLKQSDGFTFKDAVRNLYSRVAEKYQIDFIDHIIDCERSRLLSEIEDDEEPENGGFDPEEENEKNNTQVFGDSKSDERDQPIVSFDEQRYFQEYPTDTTTFGEQRHFEVCQEVERATAFVKELLTKNSTENCTLNLVDECFNYIQEQYEKRFKGVTFFREVEQLRIKFREDWDTKFLDFIKARIWIHLKENALISEPWNPGNYSNQTYNQILLMIYPELYYFAAEIIRKTVKVPFCHYLGF